MTPIQTSLGISVSLSGTTARELPVADNGAAIATRAAVLADALPAAANTAPPRALALAEGAITPEQAWSAAHVDEDWQMEQWGRDSLALERRAHREAEMSAAAKILALLR